MTDNNLENITDAAEEPPDPHPRTLNYELNGRGSPKRVFRVADAFYNGKHYVQKVDNPRVIYLQIGPNSESDNEKYICTGCESETTLIQLSRDVARFMKPHEIICAKTPFCLHCEKLPSNNRLQTVYEDEVLAYEKSEKNKHV